MRNGLLPKLLVGGRYEAILPLVRDIRAAGGIEGRCVVERAGARFRRLLREHEYVFTGGVYGALDAQIAERVGLRSVYMSGYSVAMANGWPDMGFLTMTEMTRTAATIASAVTVPVIADADDGYGNALSTLRTVEEYVKTGVAGIHLEDQRFPKRCGHIAGKTLVGLEEALGKFRAAVDVRNRRDPDFVLIARTDAYGAVGGSLDEAIRRGRAYADVGVDLVWCEFAGPEREPAIAFARAMRQTHPALRLAFNYSSSFKWSGDPQPWRFRELAELGYQFIFITLFAVHAGMYAVWNAMADLARTEEQAQWALEGVKTGHPTESHHVMARVEHFKALEQRYIPGTDERYRSSVGFGEDGRSGDSTEQSRRPVKGHAGGVVAKS